MNIADIVVADLRKLMKSAIPQIILLRTRTYGDKALEVLLNLSEEGSTSCSPA